MKEKYSNIIKEKEKTNNKFLVTFVILALIGNSLLFKEGMSNLTLLIYIVSLAIYALSTNNENTVLILKQNFELKFEQSLEDYSNENEK